MIKTIKKIFGKLESNRKIILILTILCPLFAGISASFGTGDILFGLLMGFGVLSAELIVALVFVCSNGLN